MQTMKKEFTEESLFAEIYKGAKMGADAVIGLLPHVKDDLLRSVITQQLDGYEKYAARAEEALAARGCRAKEEGIVARTAAKIGLALGAMLESDTTRLAERMIEGSNAAITALTRWINRFESIELSSDAVRLAQEVVRFEEHNLELLRQHL